ncbi:MAG: hypothetical protein AMJ60_03400 [Desulfobacterales bacterium SG8_35]|nr:MAG: hypothetical protein AMJ60_03400 [Desulfobacterales bacterium SG8_35]
MVSVHKQLQLEIDISMQKAYGRLKLFYVVTGCLYMRIPAVRTAARLGKAGPLLENKAARKTPAGDFHKFFPLAADRPFNMA